MSNFIGVAVGLVGAAIILSLGALVLGNPALDCSNAEGYNDTGTTNDEKYPEGTWAGLCYKNNQEAQTGFHMIVVITAFLIIAVVILIIKEL